jgi:hypothetical protein
MEKRMTYETVYRAVADAALSCGIEYSEEVFYSKSRLYPIVIARSTVGYILRRIMLWPVCAAGDRIKRDHSMITFYARTYPDKVKTDPTTSAVYEQTCKNLGIDISIELCPRLAETRKHKQKPRPKVLVEQESDDYIVPVNYTKEELRAIRIAKSNGTL